MGDNYSFLIDDSEAPIAELGSDYLKHFMLGNGVTKGFGVVTQQRAYFNGKTYAINLRGKFRSQVQKVIIDLKDITGTGFITDVNIAMRILAFMFMGIGLFYIFNLFIHIVSAGESGLDIVSDVNLNMLANLVLCGIHAFIGYIIIKQSRKTVFKVDYAGGSVGLNTSWYKQDDLENFQKALRKSMAEIKDKAPVYAAQSVSIQNPIQDNKEKNNIESLREYAKLRDEGIISEEEFQSIKKKLI